MEKEKTPSYNVVFRGRGDGKGNYKGIITWTSFKDIEEFEEFCKTTDTSDEILATGVTDEQAVNFSRQTLLNDQLDAATQESTINGVVNEKRLEFELANIGFLLARGGFRPDKNIPT